MHIASSQVQAAHAQRIDAKVHRRGKQRDEIRAQQFFFL
jgi:hypothetical protein